MIKGLKLNIHSRFNLLLAMVLALYISAVIYTVSVIFGIGRYTEQWHRIHNIFDGFENMKMKEKDFILCGKEDIDFYATGQSEVIEQFKQERNKIKDLLKEIETIKIKAELLSPEDLKQIKELTNKYSDSFISFSNKKRKRGFGQFGLIARLDELNDKIYKLDIDEKTNEEIKRIINNQQKYEQTLDDNYYNRFLEIYEKMLLEISKDITKKEDTETLADTTIIGIIDTTTTDTILTKDSLTFINKLVVEEVTLKTDQEELLDIIKEYQNFFEALVNIDKEIGTTEEKGIRNDMKSEKEKMEHLHILINEQMVPKVKAQLENEAIKIGLFVIVELLLLTFLFTRLSRRITVPISKIIERLSMISTGNLPKEKLDIRTKDETQDINNMINNLVEGLKKITNFAQAIGNNDFNKQFTPLSSKDKLGNALLEMRDNLKKAKEDEEERKLQDEKQNWATKGISLFNEILRQNNNNLEELAYQTISKLVDYLGANQGGIFLYSEENKEKPFLEMVASYAYDRRKYLKKTVEEGEGLVGTCALEKKTIYLTKIPDEYIKISSGLGKSNPKSLLIVPMKVDDNVMGIMELASFNPFETHQKEFVEKLAETVASTLSSVKINQKTNALLEESKLNTEMMAAQEEEMRQNMEELQATQEEMLRKQQEIEATNKQMRDSEAILNKALKKAREAEEKQRKQTTELKNKEDIANRSMEKLKKMKENILEQKTILKKTKKEFEEKEEILRKELQKGKIKDQKIKELTDGRENYEKQLYELKQKLEAAQKQILSKEKEINELKNKN